METNIISYSQAKALNLKSYFTNKPCKYGHINRRTVNGRGCWTCLEIRYKKRVLREKVSKSVIRINRITRNSLRKRQKEIDHPELLLLRSARVRARNLNLPFNIIAQDILDVWLKDNICPILGVKIHVRSLSERDNKPGATSISPSLDRILPSKGYVKGNIIVLSNRANMLKNNVEDPEIFIRLANLLLSRL